MISLINNSGMHYHAFYQTKQEFSFDSIQGRILMIKVFKKKLESRFTLEIDDDELMDELRQRTKGKGEKIAKYINKMEYIANRFRKPLNKSYLYTLFIII